MVHYRRNRLAGGTFFFTVTLADRRASTLTDGIAELRPAFRAGKELAPFSIDAIAVLREHLHAIWTLPAGDANFAARWRRIKSSFTQSVAATDHTLRPNRRGEYALWQPRYWEHTIRDEDDFARHVDYIHYNPVRHGLVARVADWPYSSFQKYVRAGIFSKDWAGSTGHNAAAYGKRS